MKFCWLGGQTSEHKIRAGCWTILTEKNDNIIEMTYIIFCAINVYCKKKRSFDIASLIARFST